MGLAGTAVGADVPGTAAGAEGTGALAELDALSLTTLAAAHTTRKPQSLLRAQAPSLRGGPNGSQRGFVRSYHLEARAWYRTTGRSDRLASTSSSSPQRTNLGTIQRRSRACRAGRRDWQPSVLPPGCFPEHCWRTSRTLRAAPDRRRTKTASSFRPTGEFPFRLRRQPIRFPLGLT